MVRFFVLFVVVLAVLFGLGTLGDLRDCLIEAEAEIKGGASPRVSPFADARDGAGLLQRAGFARIGFISEPEPIAGVRN